MSERRNRYYDKEFKLNTIELFRTSGKTMYAIENELGIGHGRIHNWIKELEGDPENVFPGNGNLSPQEKEIAKLKRELEIARQERDILKKAISIFSKTPG